MTEFERAVTDSRTTYPNEDEAVTVAAQANAKAHRDFIREHFPVFQAGRGEVPGSACEELEAAVSTNGGGREASFMDAARANPWLHVRALRERYTLTFE